MMKKLALLVGFLLLNFQPYSKNVQVLRVIDGDTFKFIDEDGEAISVRLYGIDAPEKKQIWGKEAGDYLCSLICDKTVRIDVKAKDKYGRIVAETFVDNESVNEKLLSGGYAWSYEYGTRAKDWRRFDNLARQAQFNNVGLWKYPHTRPQDFRHKK